jgi:hypothetical protein
MRPGDPRDMLEVAQRERSGDDWWRARPQLPAGDPMLIGTEYHGPPVDRESYLTAWRDASAYWRLHVPSRRRTALRLLAAFLLGLALGLLSARAYGAAPSSAVVIPAAIAGIGAFEPDRPLSGAPQRESFPASSAALEGSRPTSGAPALVRSGTASTYGPGWDGWTAIPEGPGYRIRVCGPSDCAVRLTTDAGPSLAMQREGRIVDLDVPTFEAVCGVRWTMGLCPVSVTILRVPR